MDDVVLLRLNREKVERLQTFAAIHWNDELAAELRAALDSPPVEERVEYRICGTERRTGHDWEGEARQAKPAVWHLSQLRARNDNVRVQTRIVSETPWADLEGEEEQ